MLAHFGGLIFALSIVALGGWGILQLLARGERVAGPAERLALTWVLGAGYVSVAIFFFGLATTGLPLVGAVSLGAVALYLLGGRMRRDSFEVARGKVTPWEWVLIGALAIQAVVIAWSTANFMLGWDGLCTWETKARIAFSNGGVLPAQYFHDTTRDWSHPRYPLGWAYLNSWLYLCMGGADQAWARILGSIYYLAAVGLLAGAVPRLGGSRFCGLLMGVSLFFLPMITAKPYGYYSGYADLPMAVLFLAAASRLPIWHDEPRAADERIFAAIGVLLVWTKSEGVVFVAALLGVALIGLIRLKRSRRILLFGIPAGAMLVAFGMYLRGLQATPESNYFPVTVQNVVAHAERYGPILEHMASEIVQWKLWSLLWPGTALAILGLYAAGQRLRAAAVALVIVLPWPGLTLAYVLSAWSNYLQHVNTSLSRLFLEFAPFALLGVGLAISTTVPSKTQN